METKPGWRTTEFWLTLAATTVGLLYASGLIAPESGADRWLGLMTSALTSMGYAVSRGLAKK
jgi:hypothetical protein